MFSLLLLSQNNANLFCGVMIDINDFNLKKGLILPENEFIVCPCCLKLNGERILDVEPQSVLVNHCLSRIHLLYGTPNLDETIHQSTFSSPYFPHSLS